MEKAKSKIRLRLSALMVPAVVVLGFVILAMPSMVLAGKSGMDLAGESDDLTIGEKEYCPYLDRGYPQRVFWGDTHCHSSYSTDAGMFGNRLGPDDAYRFARGEEVTASGGVRAKLVRPLDWLVVADHAENLGLAPMIAESNPKLLRIPWGKKVHDLTKGGRPDQAYAAWGKVMMARKDPLAQGDVQRTMWDRVTTYAEQNNEPGIFTALIGYEWTSSPEGNNLHRNVIFRDGKDKADRMLPLSNYDSSDPEDLWEWMATFEKETGGRVLALAHNGNLSNGLMFDDVTLTSKKPLNRVYAESRSRWEPLYEVTQIKGDGETHPMLSPNDEFADYGTWDKGSFASAKEPDMIPREYAREALKRGLKYEKQIGANPFKFGMVGSTDTHTSLSTAGESNFFGKATPGEPSADPDRLNQKITGYLPDPEGRDYAIRHYQALAAGLAGVWATQNTREAIWDAMKRKEVYATTGPRMIVRVFAGWDFAAEDVHLADFARHGYAHGVPMGGDLSKAPRGNAPAFVVRVLRDPDGANLDRVQIVKGWLDRKGQTHERVYDIDVSDGRRIGKDGRCKDPVRSTVNVRDATYKNTVGTPLFLSYWKDPDFDPQQHAFYYIRVIEIPTPTWVARDVAFFGVEAPKDAALVHQERAYTSPIWYTP
ncbi:MAG: DUF3604 domain-containing protein [Planctomycetota bacterium]|jgi:hypothetical protein